MRRWVGLVALVAMLPACDAVKTPGAGASATPLGPPTFTNITANPAAYKGAKVEFPLVTVAGDVGFISGEKGAVAGQGWRDTSGKDWEVAPAAGYIPGQPCMYLAVDDNNTPLTPLQVIAVEKLQPCHLETSFKRDVMTGKVGDVRDVSLMVDNKPTTLKAVFLTEIDYVQPKF